MPDSPIHYYLALNLIDTGAACKKDKGFPFDVVSNKSSNEGTTAILVRANKIILPFQLSLSLSVDWLCQSIIIE